MKTHLTWRDALLAVAIVFVWGTNFVVIRVALNALPPLFLATLRFALVLVPACFFIPRPRSVGDSQSDQSVKGRRRFRGKLLGLDGNDVTIQTQDARVTLPFRQIAEAKLVLTDALIAEDLKARKRAD